VKTSTSMHCLRLAAVTPKPGMAGSYSTWAIRMFVSTLSALTLLSFSSFANTVPFGPPDGLCTPTAGGPSNGVTTCTVIGGQGDTLTELVVNFTNVPVLVNSVTAGAIVGLNGPAADWIQTDPVTAGGGPLGGPFGPGPLPNCLATPTLAVGGECTFNQSFTTIPGPPGTQGESTMSFVLGITPQAPPGATCGNGSGQVLGATTLGLLYCFSANPGTNPAVQGALVVQIESADVTVINPAQLAPEPGTSLTLAGGVLLVLIGKAQKINKTAKEGVAFRSL
jgi:hypothetical protein